MANGPHHEKHVQQRVLSGMNNASQNFGKIKEPRFINKTINMSDAGRAKAKIDDKLIKDYQIINKMDVNKEVDA